MRPVALVPVTLTEEDCGKLVLYEVEGQPLLTHLFGRIGLAKNPDGLLVVTTQEEADDALAALCAAHEIPCYRGESGDRLRLLVEALKASGKKGAVLIHPDSPLIDPAVIDHVANLVELTDGMLDFIGTTLTPTYPLGMDVEGFTLAALQDSDHRCADAEERAQGTFYLRSHSKLYRILSVKPEDGLHRPDLSLAVRSHEDLPKFAAILAHFKGRQDYTMAELIAFLDQSEALER
ncbi:cytidylyltransferase domain-containing protein [Beijerinckia indica]|uniref:Spore coat polysaccharide biosynthesis protein F CMP-KDO synthetase-like protein n=1 Tax=Beijerinckia indica subsp. indica (strain ATCC 9039 / DSM 1715 / NCIMB 8712) TaxID=395963 RepID=B2IE66_BEII9|nr:spore coat polysaccharide biosynthesis protein [Beijerinckia indica]ACB94090.1 Spore coat polysaccharide biosynthesis protein F CMP-KDO synthetase-like protein [Beijerinckia indica subsp. indica ATCC 9039]